MLALITQGIGFGFGAGAMPGPLQSYLISTTLSHGWRRGILVVLAPLLADAPIVIAMTFLLDQLPDTLLRLIQIIGGVFVLWLAWGAWRELQAESIELVDETQPVAADVRQTISKAVGINWLSPGPYIFWGTTTGPLLLQAFQQSAIHGLMFLISFYGTFLLMLSGLVVIFDRLRRIDERFTRLILTAAIVLLAGLGIALIWQAIVQ